MRNYSSLLCLIVIAVLTVIAILSGLTVWAIVAIPFAIIFATMEITEAINEMDK